MRSYVLGLCHHGSGPVRRRRRTPGGSSGSRRMRTSSSRMRGSSSLAGTRPSSTSSGLHPV